MWWNADTGVLEALAYGVQVQVLSSVPLHILLGLGCGKRAAGERAPGVRE